MATKQQKLFAAKDEMLHAIKPLSFTIIPCGVTPNHISRLSAQLHTYTTEDNRQ
jgi:hypothetical protein